MKKVAVALDARIQELTKSNIGLKNQEAQTLKNVKESFAKQWQAELESIELKKALALAERVLSKSIKELAEKNEELVAFRERCKSIAEDAMIKAPTELMKEYKARNTAN